MLGPLYYFYLIIVVLSEESQLLHNWKAVVSRDLRSRYRFHLGNTARDVPLRSHLRLHISQFKRYLLVGKNL